MFRNFLIQITKYISLYWVAKANKDQGLLEQEESLEQSPVAEEAPAAASNLSICDKCDSEFHKRHIKAIMVIIVERR